MHINMEKTKRQLTTWLSICAFFVLLTVVVGGIVRLTRSGLSIVEWKPIMGVIPPIGQQQWEEAFHLYKQFPEYQTVNKGMTLSDYKFIYWWEFIHRILGRLIGIVFFIPFLIFIWQKKIKGPMIGKYLFVFFLGGLQGLIGWYMVKSGLVRNPSVSHYRLLLHLSLAYFIFCYILWIIWDMHFTLSVKNRATSFILHIKFFIALLCLQVVYGAFTAGLKAGYFYNTFPLMGGQFIPQGIWNLSPPMLNFLENRVTVQFIHRLLAFCIILYSVFLWIHARKFQLGEYQKIFLYSTIFFVSLQFLIGVLNILYAVPIALGVLHQSLAMFLLSSSTLLLHSCLKTRE